MTGRRLVLVSVVVLTPIVHLGQDTNSVTTATGVIISMRGSSAEFPKAWQMPPIGAIATPAKPPFVSEAIKGIENALKKHDPVVVRKYLRAVVLCDRLSFYGGEVGGVFTPRSQIMINCRNADYDPVQIERVFHHEFSSLLLNAEPGLFDPIKWKATLPTTFTYHEPVGAPSPEDTLEVLSNDRVNFLSEGFLCRYSTTGFENDFNMIAENLLSGSALFWRAVDRFPRLKAKIRLVIGFFFDVNPMYTEAYFRKLCETGQMRSTSSGDDREGKLTERERGWLQTMP